MIESVRDADTKKAIARKVLEALYDWFEGMIVRYPL